MDKEELERLRRELESFGDKFRRGDSGPYAAELEYHVSRLTTALTGITHLGYRPMYPHQQRAEMWAQIDALLVQTDEVRELAGRVREVLLRPPPTEEEAPGFTE